MRRIKPRITKPDSFKQEPRIKNINKDSNCAQGIFTSTPKPPLTKKSTSNPRTLPFNTKNEQDLKILNAQNYTEFSSRYVSEITTVYFVKDKRTGKLYAAKSSNENNSENLMVHILREINILMLIHHPTIIQFEGISFSDFEGNDRITIFMEYAKNKSLADLIDKYIKSLLPINFDDTNWQIILIGIAYGMMILHQNNVIHRDLKPENILIDHEFKPLITDFGYSKIFDPKNPLFQSGTTGTYQYMSPQDIYGDNFDIRTDVYSFGIILYEVATKCRAYSDILLDKNFNVFKFQQQVYNGMRPEFDETIDINENIKDLIIQCWDFNPDIRPSFQDIFEKLSLSTSGSDENYLLSEYVDVERLIDYVEEITHPTDDNDKNESDSHLNEIEAENQKLIQSNSQLNKDKKKLIDDNMQLIKDKKELARENTQLIKDKKQLASEISQLNKDKKQLNSKIAQLNDDKIQLNNEILKLTEDKKQLNNKILELTEKEKQITSQMLVLTENLNQVYKKIELLEDTIKTLTGGVLVNL